MCDNDVDWALYQIKVIRCTAQRFSFELSYSMQSRAIRRAVEKGAEVIGVMVFLLYV